MVVTGFLIHFCHKEMKAGHTKGFQESKFQLSFGLFSNKFHANRHWQAKGTHQVEKYVLPHKIKLLQQAETTTSLLKYNCQ